MAVKEKALNTLSLAAGRAAELLEVSESAVKRLSQKLGEPDWLLAQRLEAFGRFQTLPAPSPETDEDWRRTKAFDAGFFSQPIPISELVEVRRAEALHPELLASELSDGGASGLLLEQHLVGTHRFLTKELERSGVILTDISTAAREYPQLVRKYVAPTASDDSKFEALCRTLFTNGVFIYVPAGVKVPLPIWTGLYADADGSLVLPRSIVVAEPGSEVTVFEEHLSPNGVGATAASALHEVFVGEDARATVVSLRYWGQTVRAFASHRFHVQRGGRLTSLVASLGGAVTKAFVRADLLGPGAESQMFGLLFGRAKQHFDHTTIQDHFAPHTTSNLLYRAALRDEARSVYAGLIHVRPEAVRADAYQANRNLILSKEARADSLPKLEIETDDVRCTHGATVGPVDEEQTFYLMSRGLPRTEAERMIVEGFFEDVITSAREERVQNSIRRRLLKAMQETNRE
jgi:Fe-S cluster assembly protein SufD